MDESKNGVSLQQSLTDGNFSLYHRECSPEQELRVVLTWDKGTGVFILAHLSGIRLGMPRWLQSPRYFCVFPRCKGSSFQHPEDSAPTKSCNCSQWKWKAAGTGWIVTQEQLQWEDLGDTLIFITVHSHLTFHLLQPVTNFSRGLFKIHFVKCQKEVGEKSCTTVCCSSPQG